MADINFYKGTKAKYSSASLSNDSLYFTEDTKEMFLGDSKLNYTLAGYANNNTLHLPLATSDTIIQAFAKLECETVSLNQDISNLASRVEVLEEYHNIAVYTVTTSATHVTIVTNSTATQGSNLIASLRVDDGYVINTVTITMGGTDITDTAYDETAKSILINNVSGDIVINAVAVEIATYTITYNMTNCTVNNRIDSVQTGEGISISFTPIGDYHFNEGSITVTSSDGGTIPNATIVGNTVVILNITTNIVIRAVATAYQNFTVTYNLTNCTSTSNATTIKEGNNYETYIEAIDGYEIDNNGITVTVGGIPATVTNGYVSIISVSGDIVITANANVKTYSVTYNLTNVGSTNNATTVNATDTFTTTLTEVDGYDIDNVTVYVNGGVMTSQVYNPDTKTITVVKPSGSIIINANGVAKTYSVSYTLGNSTSSNNAATATYGSSYNTTISDNVGYDLQTITVMMNRENITSTAVSGKVINISRVVGDIEIIITTIKEQYNVTYNLTSVTSSNQSAVIEYGDTFTTTLSYDETSFQNLSVQVIMGGNILNDVFDNTTNTITIPNVNGAININASVSAMNLYSINLSGVQPQHITMTNTATSIIANEAYTNTLTTNKGRINVTVTMGGLDVTSSVVENNGQSNVTVNIPSVSNDIVISAVWVNKSVVGEVLTNNAITIFNDADLASGVYTMHYISGIDTDTPQKLDNWDKITEFNV